MPKRLVIVFSSRMCVVHNSVPVQMAFRVERDASSMIPCINNRPWAGTVVTANPMVVIYRPAFSSIAYHCYYSP